VLIGKRETERAYAKRREKEVDKQRRCKAAERRESVSRRKSDDGVSTMCVRDGLAVCMERNEVGM
jgi:hypothetical protein